MNNHAIKSELNPAIKDLLIVWGFSETKTDQLCEHAENVLKFANRKTGKIVEDLGILSGAQVHEALMAKPASERTLQYLAKTYRQLQSRIDEVLCVQQGTAYVSRHSTALRIHHLMKGQLQKPLIDQLTQLDFVPLESGSEVVLLFADYEKLCQFQAMGKEERLKSPIHIAFKVSEYDRSTRSFFKLAVAARAVYNTYRQALNEKNDEDSVEDRSVQKIMHSEGSQDQVIGNIVRILEQAIAQDINDVAIRPNRETGKGEVLFRKNQVLFSSGLSLSPDERSAVTRVLEVRSGANPDSGKLRRPADGKLDYEGKNNQSAFLRLSFIPLEESSIPGTSVSIRIFPKTESSVDLKELNIPADLLQELDYYSTRKQGLILVAGPTGSGKSTTIGGMICKNYYEYGDELKRIAVENPCERILPGTQHVDVSQYYFPESEGLTVNRFEKTLRAIVRHDPDVIFVGEVRDKESCKVSVDAANTGHLVFTTTHANSPVMGFRRLSQFLDADQRYDLAAVLECVLAQRLVPVVCPDCSSESPFDEHDLLVLTNYAVSKGIAIEEYTLPSTKRKVNKSGCDQCDGGHIRMVPVHGLMKVTPHIRQLLLSGSASELDKAEGMTEKRYTMFFRTMELFNQGQIELNRVVV